MANSSGATSFCSFLSSLSSLCRNSEQNGQIKNYCKIMKYSEQKLQVKDAVEDMFLNYNFYSVSQCSHMPDILICNTMRV